MSDADPTAPRSGTAAQHGAGGPTVALSAARIGVAWNVQGDPERSSCIAEVRRLFDVELPRSPNTTARTALLTAYWLGPGSWLLAGALPLSSIEFVPARDALNAAGAALFDVSASRVAYDVQGPRANDVLAAGCPLDFHPRAFPAGSCRQSLLFRVAALIEKYDEAPGYRLFVARSFAGGVWNALCLAAAEHGCDATPRPADG